MSCAQILLSRRQGGGNEKKRTICKENNPQDYSPTNLNVWDKTIDNNPPTHLKILFSEEKEKPKRGNRNPKTKEN